MNTDMKESTNINPGPRIEIFLYDYNEMLTHNFLQKKYWNTGNVYDKIITMEGLKEALKN